MAAPTPVTNTKQSGKHGWTAWSAVWTDTTNITDSVVVDVSALATYNTSLKIKKLTVYGSAGISVRLEFDDDSADELVAYYPLGVTSPLVLDFTNLTDGGLTRSGSGGTGDLVVTTLSAAAADEVFIFVEWMAN